MARFTMFEELTLAVRSLGVNVVEQSRKKLLLLQTEGIEIDDDSEIIRAPHGIYSILPDGSVVRVILHITQKTLYRGDELAEDRFHRYHLFNCQTLQRMESIGRADRYRMASRTDGRFTYTVRRRDRVVKEYRGESGAELRFCRNCLGIYEENFSRRLGRTFSLHEFMADNSAWMNPPRVRRFDSDDIPDVYAADWNLISTRAKNQRGYRCEECAIDLSAPHLRKYLHTHHIDGQRANSVATNLRVLCIAHHADQPLHGHLKQLREYQDFLQTEAYRNHHRL